LSFKDSFSKTQAQSFNVPTTVKSASQLSAGRTLTTQGNSSGEPELTYLAYGVVAAMGASLVVGAFMLRRYRAKRFASLPSEQKGEQSVI